MVDVDANVATEKTIATAIAFIIISRCKTLDATSFIIIKGHAVAYYFGKNNHSTDRFPAERDAQAPRKANHSLVDTGE
jgi:hypothetical protein